MASSSWTRQCSTTVAGMAWNRQTLRYQELSLKKVRVQRNWLLWAWYSFFWRILPLFMTAPYGPGQDKFWVCFAIPCPLILFVSIWSILAITWLGKIIIPIQSEMEKWIDWRVIDLEYGTVPVGSKIRIITRQRVSNLLNDGHLQPKANYYSKWLSDESYPRPDVTPIAWITLEPLKQTQKPRLQASLVAILETNWKCSANIENYQNLEVIDKEGFYLYLCFSRLG